MNSLTLSALQKAKPKILHIARKHGASNVRVFGSVARNEATPESDLDFLVELAPDRSLLDHAALIARPPAKVMPFASQGCKEQR